MLPLYEKKYKNILLNIILNPLSKSPFSVQPSEEEEIVDLMLMKLGSLFGLKCKKENGDGQTENATFFNNGPSIISPGSSFSH